MLRYFLETANGKNYTIELHGIGGSVNCQLLITSTPNFRMSFTKALSHNSYLPTPGGKKEVGFVEPMSWRIIANIQISRTVARRYKNELY